MTTAGTINLHFDRGDVGHDYRAGTYATLDIGTHRNDMRAVLHFRDTAEIDEVIAELVALRAEMTCGNDGSDGDGILLCTLPPHGPEQRHEKHDEFGGVIHWTAVPASVTA